MRVAHQRRSSASLLVVACALWAACAAVPPSQTSCVPSCAASRCGPDGCGGSCGSCAGDASCTGGVCVEPLPACRPDCSGRLCGDDGCGGSCGSCAGDAGCTGGVCVEPLPACRPDCSGRLCGDDGCGGSCGACPSGDSCAQGACLAPTPTSSPGCPLGGVCTYLERIAWRYDCTSAVDCQPSGVIGTYGSFEACQTWGCMGGNSRCGDQFGNERDADRWSCEACKVSCTSGSPTACGAANETAQGCLLEDSTWGAYLAACICM